VTIKEALALGLIELPKPTLLCEVVPHTSIWVPARVTANGMGRNVHAVDRINNDLLIAQTRSENSPKAYMQVLVIE
jgi:hypothetical protein